MDLSKLISNSIKYPFRNLKKLPVLCLLFVLITIIPIGLIANNNYITAIGAIAFFIFILIVPGYFLSMIKLGSNHSEVLPSFNLANNIHDSIRVISLRIVYMLVPAALFLIALMVFGPASRNLINDLKILEFLATMGLVFVLILIVYLISEFLLFFAKARLAYFNSLSEALKINKVIRDIANIGIFNIIKWLIVMAILLNVIAFVSSFVISIPYVGFLIYGGIVIPIIESIVNYSIGLLYSNIADNYSLTERL